MTNRPVSCLLLAALISGPAEDGLASEQIVRLAPSDGVAMFVKRFMVSAGTTITGVEFRNEKPTATFPEVVLVRGSLAELSEGTVVAQATAVSEVSGGWVHVSWSQAVEVTQAEPYWVGVRVPDVAGTGPGIGAVRVTSPQGSFVASGSEGTLTPALVDFSMNLVTVGTSGKPAMGEPGVLRTFLSGGSPNPFNPSTVVEFVIAEQSEVVVAIYDVAGRQVRSLSRGPFVAGTHRLVWDGRDDRGVPVAAGVYIIELVVDGRSFREKVVLAK